jgi:hypothetical protein
MTSSWTGDAKELADRISLFLRSAITGSPSEPFSQLACDVANFQRLHSSVAAALHPEPISNIDQIPAVPVSLFKDLRVGTIAENEPHHTFLTSGTTGGGRGAHHLRNTTLYDLGSLLWANHITGGIPDKVIALLDDPLRHPESSLSHMVRLFNSDATWLLKDGVRQPNALTDAIQQTDQPIFLAATAFALGFALADEDLPTLPPHSIVMVTGGFKGRNLEMDDATLYAQVQAQLQPSRLITEYGMTELSSQLWGTPTTPYHPPPWLRVSAHDPLTGALCPSGHIGQLRFLDLCNLDSALSIETLDQGVVHEDGTVTLHGRLSESPIRGCSLGAKP